MNVFHKVAREGLKKNKTRTFVTILGVILSAALITGVVSFGYSLLGYLADGAAYEYGDWHIAVSDADDKLIEKEKANKHISSLTCFENDGYALLDDCKNENKPYLFVAGFTKDAFDTLPVTLLSGRLPKNTDEIVLPAHLASNGGIKWKLGDSIALKLGDRNLKDSRQNQNNPYSKDETYTEKVAKKYTVVGICQRPNFENESAAGYTAITCSDGNHETQTVFVKLNNPYNVSTFAKENLSEYSSSFNTDVLRFMGVFNGSSDDILVTLMISVGIIVIAIIMVGSVFLIFNAFNISLSERMQQIGILSSVGATPKQLKGSVLYEGLCIGAIGIPIGVLVGLGAIYAVMQVVASSFTDVLYTGVPLTLRISIPVILGAVVISLITILISAYIPAKKAANRPVMECIRQTDVIKVSGKKLKTSRLSEKLWGLEGTLALKNFKRNKKQYRSIVLSLVLSILLFVGTSSFVNCLSEISDNAKMVTDYDIGFGTEEMSSEAVVKLYEELKEADGVTKSGYQALCESKITVEGKDYSATLQFIDDDSYLNLLSDFGLSKDGHYGENAKYPSIAKSMQDEENAKDITDLADLFDSNTVQTQIGTQKVQVECIDKLLPDVPPFAGNLPEKDYYLNVLIPFSEMESMNVSDDFFVKGMTFCSSEPAKTMEIISNKIQGKSVTEQYLLINNTEILSENQNFIFIANVFSYTFIVMITLIAVANVFNTISTNIKLRRRELAMIRSVGMSDRDFMKMMRFECVFYGLRAVLFGVPISLVLSYLIQKVLLDGMKVISITNFDIPYQSLGIGIFGVLTIIFVTMMYTVSKLKKENIIEALRDEMA